MKKILIFILVSGLLVGMVLILTEYVFDYQSFTYNLVFYGLAIFVAIVGTLIFKIQKS